MNTPSVCPPRAPDTGADRILQELADRNSVWYQLRWSVMSGYDYVFVPEQHRQLLSSLPNLQQFVYNLHTLAGTPMARIVPVLFWYNASQLLGFVKYELEWHGGVAIDRRETSLTRGTHLDFISTLFDYSEPLLADQ